MVIAARNINSLNIEQVNTLILPSGNYKETIKDGLTDWVKRGGRLVLIESAIRGVVGKKGFDIKKVDSTANINQEENYGAFASRNRSNFDNAIPGAIYKISLDDTHPFSYGIGKAYYGLKTDDFIYKPFAEGWNVGLINPTSFMAGVVGKAVRKSLNSGLFIGSQDLD
ncbi:hypothetical protein ABIB40_000966 [Pedobacter sp. UYP30]|uniref:hypothetical protein n=1 Tax=Pedobacter sp. UYP30 TaxID=1756400 RepID=UPI0033980913